MEPITREEYYLAKIAGTYKGKTPEPVTIDEYYLATMAGDYSGNTPQPVTRLQYYMAKVAGVWDGSIPAPVTRLEYYWAAIASGEGKVFPPVTREEHFLVLVADAYSVVLTVVTGNPALLENSKGNRGLESLTLHGKSTQVSTTGAQLCDFRNRRTISGGGNIIITFNKDGIGIAKGTPGNEPYAFTIFGDPVDLSLLEIGETYTTNESIRYANKDNLERYFYSKSVMFTEDIAKIEIYIQRSVKEYKDGEILSPMFNKGNTVLAFEPYTGGKPSPSPEYPQKIESAGQSGEIGVEVYGGNLAFSNEVRSANDAVAYLYGLQKFYVKAKRSSGKSQVNIRFYYVDGTSGNDRALLQAGDTKDEKSYEITAKQPVKYITIYAVGVSENIPKTTLEYLNVSLLDIPYEPYKPTQKLIIPTPNGLPGIPVSSGGNYTDKEGQQWVCDEVDFKKGVYVQRCAKYISFGGENLNAPSTQNGVDQYVIPFKSGIDKNFMSFGISNKFKCKNKFEANTFTVSDMFIYFRFAENTQTPETIREVLNGCEFWYVLATPIETHLSSADLAAYKALRTYSPTTTVINDAEAGMSVGYAKMK